MFPREWPRVQRAIKFGPLVFPCRSKDSLRKPSQSVRRLRLWLLSPRLTLRGINARTESHFGRPVKEVSYLIEGYACNLKRARRPCYVEWLNI